MPKPIALQLYTLRDALAQDFETVIGRVADIGYAGVETAGLHGRSPDAAARLFQSLGLAVPAAHIDLPLGDRKQEVLDTMAALGAKYLVKAWLPESEFQTVAQIRANCDRLNEANDVARAAGLTLVYHNHWWEYMPLNGRYGYQVMLDNLDPTIQFEIDTYWVAVGGKDPVNVIQQLGKRAPLLHIKDGPLKRDEPMVAVGDGKMEFGPIVSAAEDTAEWLVVELDRCATDMLQAVETSYTYLVGRGLARGR